MTGSLKLYRTARGAVLEADGGFFVLKDVWDVLLNRRGLAAYLKRAAARGRRGARIGGRLLAPCVAQEVWGAGVTYDRSRTARMDESQAAGGGGGGGASFYDREYSAERPELFFKCPGWRARGSGQPVRIRKDARWSVPEPELAVVANSRGQIVGYTIGNDLSARDIEAENPLYLPQAKIWDGACALGPAVLVREEPLPPETEIALRVVRQGKNAIAGGTTLARMRRPFEELVRYLFRETSFPAGCLLLTGTGIVPPDDFTLRAGDEIEITVPEIGTLRNRVA